MKIEEAEFYYKHSITGVVHTIHAEFAPNADPSYGEDADGRRSAVAYFPELSAYWVDPPFSPGEEDIEIGDNNLSEDEILEKAFNHWLKDSTELS